MRIVIEGYRYAANDVKDILWGIDALENIEGYVTINYVGYYYNPHIQDCVFILPKVLLEVDEFKQEKVFGIHLPKDLLNLDVNNPLSENEKKFIYEFSVWIYRAIVVFKKANPTSDIVYHKQIAQVGKGRKRINNTFLDILLSLIQFNKNNQNFFFFILRNLHSGFNKINWNRTISTTTAVIQDGCPVYINPVNKKRQINFDEELLVIFFSILNYIGDHYGFPKNINCNFELITGKQFEKYLHHKYGRTRLLQIKYKYFSDKALELWHLCFAFFDNAHKIVVNTEQKEYLLVKNFNIVFEAIIDELIGTNHSELPPRLADQSDGKQVDHLWIDDIILPTTEKKPVYYIGDSKYYKSSTPMGEKSIYKQFTYARNVIQWSFDAIMGRTKCDDEKYKIRLRDDRTEGYNVIPNFFISAEIDFKHLDYTHDNLQLHDGKDLEKSDQFSDRLFDRDTLLLSYYDVNFLFVIALYGRNEANSKARWKADVRKKFRERVQDVLDKKYIFYALQGYDKEESEQFITNHFQQLLGKLYRVEGETDIYTFAIEKKDDGSTDDTFINELRKYFYVAECNIKADPKEKIKGEMERLGNMNGGKAIVIDDNHCDQTAESIRQHWCYAIGLGTSAGALALAEGFVTSKYLVLHKLTSPIVFRLKEGPKLVTKEQIGDIPRRLKDSEIFLLFEVLEEEFNLPKQISQYALNHPKGHDRRDSYVIEVGALLKKGPDDQ